MWFLLISTNLCCCYMWNSNTLLRVKIKFGGPLSAEKHIKSFRQSGHWKRREKESTPNLGGMRQQMEDSSRAVWELWWTHASNQTKAKQNKKKESNEKLKEKNKQRRFKDQLKHQTDSQTCGHQIADKEKGNSRRRGCPSMALYFQYMTSEKASDHW